MKKSGIYTIEINNKFYVGSAKDLDNRKSTHEYKLRKGIHENIHLQRAYNKSKDFKFEIIEYCDIELLESLEKYWMNILDVLKIGYNICPNPGSYKGKKMRTRVRNGLTKSIKGKKQSLEHVIKRTVQAKIPIIQFNINYELIREWDSAIDAARSLDMDNSEIGKCCKGKSKSVKGFIFKYK